MGRFCSYLVSLLMTAFVSSCEEPAEVLQALCDPTDLSAEQLDPSSVKLTWKDNAQGEKGYRIFLRGEGDPYSVEPLTVIGADTAAFVFEGLEAGALYDFGIQALSENIKLHSKIVYLNDFKIAEPETEEPETEEPGKEEGGDEQDKEEDHSANFEIVKVKTSYSYVAVSYKIKSFAGADPERGLCFSASGVPSVDDIKVPGPEFSAGKEVLQVVSAACLDADKEYQMSVYMKDGDIWQYSKPQTVRLEDQPAEMSLAWEKQSYEGLADGIEIYRTTSQLNGRNLNAWYAVADPSKVEFRVMYPEAVKAKKTVAAQAEAAEGCQVLINGAIYGNYNIGVIMTEGKMTQQWHGEIEGCYWATNDQLYQITRPIIGVDKDGKAGAYWVGVPYQGSFHYYDRPQTNVVGQAKYPRVTATTPSPVIDWKPYYAISCGPMVLYDGKVCADNTMVDETHYYTNYECWSESGVYSAHPDRTAVGVTAEGKIVLFICDGRIDASQGAYIKELGPIMKSLGCVHAMNLDGGGSTGMWVKGAGMINHKDGSWREVKSTLGFFKK